MQRAPTAAAIYVAGIDPRIVGTWRRLFL